MKCSDVTAQRSRVATGRVCGGQQQEENREERIYSRNHIQVSNSLLRKFFPSNSFCALAPFSIKTGEVFGNFPCNFQKFSNLISFEGSVFDRSTNVTCQKSRRSTAGIPEQEAKAKRLAGRSIFEWKYFKKQKDVKVGLTWQEASHVEVFTHLNHTFKE